MPEPRRYVTVSGLPPNGGVPPGRLFRQAAIPPPIPEQRPEPTPPAAMPTAAGMAMLGGDTGHTRTLDAALIPETGFCNFLWGQSPPPYTPCHPPSASPAAIPAPSAPPAQAAAANPNASHFQPPGSYVNGQPLQGEGWSYITESAHTNIHFVGDGSRPCDFPDSSHLIPFKFTKHKVACSMKVQELMKRLGCPEGDQYGIEEMVKSADGKWRSGFSVTQGNAAVGALTLSNVGWGEGRGEDSPVWLVVKR